ncbi:hypothetical protein ACPOL_4125 [Acidisarcina polymorpha]|uniref:Uncharacterized protein n=1 Tax=Acidisarcina polymorpha TaxID=2211140 RepID=A0A2Z5G2Q6_9BACT|nr:hypothetical protein ACPOL_4125 [Acidisarcina polymorpha]
MVNGLLRRGCTGVANTGKASRIALQSGFIEFVICGKGAG